MRSKAPFFFFCLSTTCGAYRMTAPRCQFCTLFFFLFFYFSWVFTLSRALSCVRLGTLSSCECWTCIVVDRYSRLLCSFFFSFFFFGRVMFVHSCLCEMCWCTHVVFSRGSANGFLTFFMRLVAFFFPSLFYSIQWRRAFQLCSFESCGAQPFSFLFFSVVLFRFDAVVLLVSLISPGRR